ncbi:MAG TPA: hypothetical protein DIW54_04035 [Chitinophagaceae bacterium]|nr:hypothetical protein [Chitinophagaceae bacterium]
MRRKILGGFLGLTLFVLACSKPIDIGGDCTNNAPSIGEQNNKTADEAVLKSLYDELIILSQSNNCTGDKTWRITPYGAKACGGPIGFLPYRTDIDTTCFLQKVYHFTQQQQRFNTRYGIASDCSVPPSPKSVQCNNGKAELVY